MRKRGLKRVAEKLESRRGASMVMALLLLAVCMFSGMSALTSARSNVSRYGYLLKYQQEYLSVSSAARLIKSQLCDLKIDAQYVYTPQYLLNADEAREGSEDRFGEIKSADVELSYKFGGSDAPPADSVCRLISDGLCEMLWKRFCDEELSRSGWLAAKKAHPPTELDIAVYELSVEVLSDEAFVPVSAKIKISGEKISVVLKSEDGGYALGFEADIRCDGAVFHREEEFLETGNPLSVSRLKKGSAEVTVSADFGSAVITRVYEGEG